MYELILAFSVFDSSTVGGMLTAAYSSCSSSIGRNSPLGDCTTILFFMHNSIKSILIRSFLCTYNLSVTFQTHCPTRFVCPRLDNIVRSKFYSNNFWHTVHINAMIIRNVVIYTWSFI
ncbi:ORF_020R [Scale drop disease virus]|uniref:ORF_020R n=1 Tax=Scale drop disease virus TaxID=1697349 RepID=A0A0K1L730_9VIRU|nr:ORF_020R [Scale drop disease virus]AKU37435.1 ORF_020R [Scale drop disease virus]